MISRSTSPSDPVNGAHTVNVIPSPAALPLSFSVFAASVAVPALPCASAVWLSAAVLPHPANMVAAIVIASNPAIALFFMLSSILQTLCVEATTDATSDLHGQ